ncbi:MAG: hypothetical protein RLY24_1122 [Actinomycetota bacterium]|jgi:hypothetical protein
MTLPRILTIMGSGETAPTMVSTHRNLTSKLPSPAKAVLLDTPYGFQENAPELARRAVEYFKTSVNVDITVAGLVRLTDTHLPADPVAIERGLRAVADSHYVFAGPGSPTYALRQWNGSPIARLLTEKIATGGIVTFASAAALTLGKATVPVYEIYKVGQNVELLNGLDILSSIGMNVAVIPHYDNAEGGNHDTRFCYLGETRLELFETMLDDATWVLGVDEHTGLVIDIDAQSATVVGNGTVTIRLRGTSHVFPSGSAIPLATLQNPWSALTTGNTATTNTAISATASHTTTQDVSTGNEAGSLADELRVQQEEFSQAIENRDADRAVRACLALEQAMHEWSADTLQGDIMDRAREALRSMISRLGDAAVSGVKNPRDVVGPYVEAMLQVRATVRAEKRYDLSDILRDAFVNIGIEVRDTADGVEWNLRADS